MTYSPGPFLTASLYLQWGGILPGGEQFSCGLRIAPTTGTAIEYTDANLTACAAAVATWHANASISPRALLTFTKLNAIDGSGHYSESVTHEHFHASVPGGGTDGNTQANQVALAVSTTTGFARGPAHRGRFYMPLPTILIGADGEIPTSDRGYVVGKALALLAAVNAAQPTGQAVSVMSRKMGAPFNRVVTGIQVGRVYDTQRRRRNKLAENYS
jgi:hypothetical protein